MIHRRRAVVAALTAVLVTGCDASDETPAADAGSPTAMPSAQASPSPTLAPLAPLPQPEGPWPAPELDDSAGSDASVAEELAFQIERRAHQAAGSIGSATVDCAGLEGVDDRAGSHQFDCAVEYADQSFTVPLSVDVDLETFDLTYEFTAPQLPLTKEKVTYEVTRQTRGPAAVDCSMPDVAVVTVNDPGGITCTVTHVNHEVTTHRVELNADGSVVVLLAG